MFGIGKKQEKQIVQENKNIFFDIDLILAANPQVEEEINNGNYANLDDYFQNVDVGKALENGTMKFHKLFNPFDEKIYLQLFPDVNEGIRNGSFQSAFEHFKYFGYKEIISNARIWEKTENKNYSKIAFHIDYVDNSFIGGWILDENYLDRKIILGLYINDTYIIETENTFIRKDIGEIYGVSAVGFNFEIPKEYKNVKRLKIDLKILVEDEMISFLDESILWVSPDILIEEYIEIQKILINNQSISSNILRRDIIPNLINKIRENYNISSIKNEQIFQQNYFPHNASPQIEITIDIIIPIYRNVSITQKCIESVLKADNKTKYKLILINDKSPDQDMLNMLKKYLVHSNVFLLNNEENLGFVASANKGMQLHDRDVILLNSDTIVTNYWIDKLINTAYSQYNIATVTPLSNNATILSYPEFLVDNKMPENFSAESLNKISSEVNRDLVIDLPTAHGFCMFIKRVVLLEIGLFNEKKYGKGYAEENDFSLRAATNGWRNVAACDTFIQHIGSVSFLDHQHGFLKKNLETLNTIYPEYASLVTRFIEKDPLYIARRNISKEIYKELNKKYMLFVLHTLGGGTEIAAKDLSLLLKNQNQSVLILECVNKKYILKSYDQVFKLEYKLNEWDILLDDLKELGIWHIHFHHILEFDLKILDLAKHLNIKYDFTVHDYLVICPRINLIDERKVYCNEPDVKVCNKCIEHNGVRDEIVDKYEKVGRDMEQWRSRFYLFMKNARKVFVPNEDVFIRLTNYYTLDNLTIKAHPEKEKIINFKNAEYINGRIKVAILGAINENKGFYRLKECIHYAQQHNLPIDFIVIGYTCNDPSLSIYNNVTIVGKYNKKDLNKLITQYQCTITLFLSIWPETFSYTFSEALENSLYPISYNIGAIATRSKYYNFGELISIDSSAKDLNEVILSVASRNIEKVFKIGCEYNNIIKDYYEFNKKYRTL